MKESLLRISLVLLLSLYWIGGSAQLKAVFDLVTELHHPPKHTGLLVGLISGENSEVRGFGQRSKKDPSPPVSTDLFEIGGLSATFTSMLMLASQKDGAFFLEQAVEDFLPAGIEVPHYLNYRCVELNIASNPAGRPKRTIVCSPDPDVSPVCMTFCDLSTHTSGLPLSLPQGFNWNPFVDDRKWQALETGLDQAHWLEKLPDIKLKNPPGTEFRYSNLGIALLGYSLEQIHHLSYDEMLEKWLAEPFGLQQTRTASAISDRGSIVPGHDYKGRQTRPFQTEALAPAAGLLSSAADLTRMLKAMLWPQNPEIQELVEQSIQERVEVTFPTAPAETLVTYGWMSTPIKPESNRRVYWQYGGTAGYRAFMGLVPDTDTGIVLLANSSEPILELAFALLNKLQPPSPKKTKK